MFKRVLYLSALAVAGTLLTPGESSAQWRGWRGRGGLYGRGYYGGYNGYGRGYGGYGYGRLGSGYGYSAYNPSYYYEPDSSAAPTYDRRAYYYTPGAQGYGEEQQARNDARALMAVRVPANAEVWVEGDKTSQTGTARSFISPPLETGKRFTYDIRARWMGADGKPVDQTRQVKVEAGRRAMVDFTAPNPAPDGKDKPLPKSGDIPPPKP